MGESVPSFWVVSDVGRVRKTNEDAYLWLGPEQTGNHGWLFVVADGMGGESAGDVASATLIHAIREVYPVAVAESGDPFVGMRRAIKEGNRRILEIVETHPTLKGMGTTIVALAVHRGQAHVVHVGDSRAYWLHRGELVQLTRDHTKVELLVELGHITREEAKKHPEQNVLWRTVGRAETEPDENGSQPFAIGDEPFLLSSDGLTGVVPHAVLREALGRLGAREATEALVELARRYRSQDNITAAVVRFGPPAQGMASTRESFLEWVNSGGKANPFGKTVVLGAVSAAPVEERPPQTNVEKIPAIRAPERSVEPKLASAGPVHLSTMSFSLAEVAQLRAAPAAAASAPALPPVGLAPAASSGPLDPSGFSQEEVTVLKAVDPKLVPGAPPGSLAAHAAAGSAGGEAAPAGPTGTMAFSPQEAAQLRAAAGLAAGPPPASPGPQPLAPTGVSFQAAALANTESIPISSPGAPAPAVVATGTISFSPQEAAQLRAAAGAPLAEARTTAMPSLQAVPVGGAAPAHSAGVPAYADRDSAQARHIVPAVAPAPSDFSAPPAATSEHPPIGAGAAPAHGRSRTVALSAEDIAALQAPAEEAPPRTGLLAFAAIAALLLVGASLVYLFVLRKPTAEEDIAAVDAGAPVDAEIAAIDVPRAVVPDVAWNVIPPNPIPAAVAPRMPDGVHLDDGMPWYRVSLPIGEDGVARSIDVDAHEVLVQQMTMMRQDLPDMELVYGASTTALYEFLPCDGVYLGDAAGQSRRPVCVAPEAAEAYCASVGRRLPTPDDWRAILAAGAPFVSPSRGQVWQRRADGLPPEQEPGLQAIAGAFDGLPEILRGTIEEIRRGDLPILVAEPGATEPIVMRPGLLTALRARTLPLDETPMIGFRCVFDPPPQEVAVVQPDSQAGSGEPLSEEDQRRLERQRRREERERERQERRERRERERAEEEAREEAEARARRWSREHPGEPMPNTEAPDAGPGDAVAVAVAAPDAAVAEDAVNSGVAAPEDGSGVDLALRGLSERRSQRRSRRERIQLMDPVYLPSTIEEYEQQVRQQQNGGAAPDAGR